jgi:hypothetical protein
MSPFIEICLEDVKSVLAAREGGLTPPERVHCHPYGCLKSQ